MAKKGLSHIALKARDLRETEQFYVGILGLEVAFRHPPKMLFLTTPGSGDLVNFVQDSRPARGRQGLAHIGFRVTAPALKRMESILKKNRIGIDSRRGRSAFYITDPNGYQLEFYCD